MEHPLLVIADYVIRKQPLMSHLFLLHFCFLSFHFLLAFPINFFLSLFFWKHSWDGFLPYQSMHWLQIGLDDLYHRPPERKAKALFILFVDFIGSSSSVWTKNFLLWPVREPWKIRWVNRHFDLFNSEILGHYGKG